MAQTKSCTARWNANANNAQWNHCLSLNILVLSMHTLAIFILSFSLLICNNFFLSVRFWTFIEWKKVACDAYKKCVYFKTYNKHIKVANVNNATATIKVKLPACKRHRKEWWNCFYLLALLNSMIRRVCVSGQLRFLPCSTPTIAP